ncbi:iron complex transport system substrate-binding protein [Cyclobacterium lianum]|uniref:Iron complex transport system substrate-binding protein n=1 Tax=Cyclobacterium lianum TaxID=388280 RepID=A0A1M7P8Z4_9BACT|nr:ABC transporter substrate-binding protein [Cyclobacterium lianum]SHN13132.1 iron complex transport system substrate-binding protein [Cyclobacterium lianum]
MLFFKREIVFTRTILAIWLILSGCSENQQNSNLSSLEKIHLDYAQGFSIYKDNDCYLLEIGQKSGNGNLFLVHPPGKKNNSYTGALTGTIPKASRKIILTATTQIPHLTYLKAEEALIAFPNPDLISSPAVRKRIAENKIEDLGPGPSADIEKIIAADPDWVMISGFGEAGQLLERLKAADIPVIVNGEYLEKHPLGRSEWIKLTGVLLGKTDLADSIFAQIEKNYRAAASITRHIPEKERPTVLSGSLYKDIWYAPAKESWAAGIIQDAGGAYIFRDLDGSGSLSLNYEFVLENGRRAQYWIGASDFKNLGQMVAENARYENFDAFQQKKVYTYTRKRGATGGLLYFEEGYLRPDWVLLDMIKILHPTKAAGHEFQYFKRLNE